MCNSAPLSASHRHMHSQGPAALLQAVAHACGCPCINTVAQDFQLPNLREEVTNFLGQCRARAGGYVCSKQVVVAELRQAELPLVHGPAYVSILRQAQCTPIPQWFSTPFHPPQCVQVCTLGGKRSPHRDADFSAPQFPHRMQYIIVEQFENLHSRQAVMLLSTKLVTRGHPRPVQLRGVPVN